MKFDILKDAIRVVPTGDTAALDEEPVDYDNPDNNEFEHEENYPYDYRDAVYIEQVLGLKKHGDSIRLVRIDGMVGKTPILNYLITKKDDLKPSD